MSAQRIIHSANKNKHTTTYWFAFPNVFPENTTKWKTVIKSHANIFYSVCVTGQDWALPRKASSYWLYIVQHVYNKTHHISVPLQKLPRTGLLVQKGGIWRWHATQSNTTLRLSPPVCGCCPKPEKLLGWLTNPEPCGAMLPNVGAVWLARAPNEGALGVEANLTDTEGVIKWT